MLWTEILVAAFDQIAHAGHASDTGKHMLSAHHIDETSGCGFDSKQHNTIKRVLQPT